MPLFAYRARDRYGNLSTGKMDVPAQDQVATRLINDQLTPIHIEAIEEESISIFHKDLSGFLPKPKVNLEDLVLFCRQMHALTRAGIPIMRAVFGLAETTRNPTLVEILKEVGHVLSRGNTLTMALGNYPDTFPSLFVSMINVGESTGKLDEAFFQLINHLEMERETKKKVSAALRYPMFVITAILIAIIVVNIAVIPSFASVFARFGADLPLATQALLATSNLIVTYGWVMALATVALFIMFIRYIKTPEGAYRWDSLKLKLPLIGDLINRIALSRFTRTFSMLFSAGVPILQALEISANAIGNLYIEKAVKEMRSGIERGDSLARTATSSKMFTPLILQMIAVGEESGALDRLLNDVSDFYDEETDYDVKNIASAVEPILLVFMGCMILVLALGIFLPLWDLGSTAR